ncbi:MAG: hypothetical protein HRU29_10965 [Rhizobiales bacterium]|nr:hypothetical protein [Hyphomicrobiales bacterium]NRB14914.1 hypothetical protein [Hyphomicrobiales bacterium]
MDNKSLDAYLDLDISIDGKMAEKLFVLVANDLKREKISITSLQYDDLDTPAGFTPAMMVWFKANIASARRKAISELTNKYAKIKIGSSENGFIPEARQQKIEKTKYDSIRTDRELYFTLDVVKRQIGKVNKAFDAYQKRENENGGEAPNEWPRLPYFLLLMSIGVAEAFLNYSALLTQFKTIPLVAIGLTLLVAFAIAWGGHQIGTTIKQWNLRLGKSVKPADRTTNKRWFSLANVLIVLALVVVAWSRGSLLLTLNSEKILFGEQLAVLDYVSASFSVVGNLIVLSLGVLFAMSAHCKVPGLAMAESVLKTEEAKMSKIYKRELEDKKGEHIEKAKLAHENLNNLVKLKMDNIFEFDSLNSELHDLKAQDNAVIAVLTDYKSKLLTDCDVKTTKDIFYTNNIELYDNNSVEKLSNIAFDTQHIQLMLLLE